MRQNFILNIFIDLFVLLITFLSDFSYFSRFSFFLHSYTCAGLRTESVLVFSFLLSCIVAAGKPAFVPLKTVRGTERVLLLLDLCLSLSPEMRDSVTKNELFPFVRSASAQLLGSRAIVLNTLRSSSHFLSKTNLGRLAVDAFDTKYKETFSYAKWQAKKIKRRHLNLRAFGNPRARSSKNTC